MWTLPRRAWAPGILLACCLWWLFFLSHALFLHAGTEQRSPQDSRNSPCVSSRFSLGGGPLSLLISPTDSGCLGLPRFWCVTLTSSKSCCLLLDGPLPVQQAGNCLKWVSWHLEHILCWFPFLRDHSLWLPAVECRIIIGSYAFSECLHVYKKRMILVVIKLHGQQQKSQRLVFFAPAYVLIVFFPYSSNPFTESRPVLVLIFIYVFILPFLILRMEYIPKSWMDLFLIVLSLKIEPGTSQGTL